MLSSITDQLRGMDLDGAGNIKTTVANIRLLGTIKSKLTSLVLTDDYLASVKDFVDAFNTVTTLQNLYWVAAEKDFKPTPLLREIRIQAVTDTVNMLTESGVGVNISDNIASILRQNITTGGSYKSLENQLRESLTDTQKSDGLLTKYTKQVTTDSINQYNRQYTQVVASSYDYEWYSYANSLIKTSRPFCIAMHERDYFHISEIPDLLDAVDLFYTNPKSGKREQVPIYSGTGLPAGMYDNENADNFLVLLGGYNCGHQARPVSESLVMQQDPGTVARVKATPEYAAYNTLTS
jgi:hypothetical protein